MKKNLLKIILIGFIIGFNNNVVKAAVTVTVTTYTSSTNGITTPLTLQSGQANFIPIGFKVVVAGGTTSYISDLYINTTYSNPATLFTSNNIKLVRTSGSTYSAGSVQATYNCNGNGSQLKFNINTSLATDTYYYFLVINPVFFGTTTPPSTIAFSVAASQLFNNNPAVSLSGSGTGNTYNAFSAIYWYGDNTTDWASNNGWQISNGSGGYQNANRTPGASDIVYIGVAPYSNNGGDNPIITSSTINVSQIIFGTVNSKTGNTPRVTLAGTTPALNAGISCLTNSTGSVLGTGTLTLPTSSTSNMATSSNLTIAPKLVNNGSLSNSGNVLTVSGAVTNSSTGSIQLSTGTSNFNAGITNTAGTITQTGGVLNSTNVTNTGTITLGTVATTFSAGFTNNTGGAFTAGSGTVTIGGITTLNAGTITTGSNTFSTVGLDVYGGTLQAGAGNFTNTHFTRLNAGSEILNFGSGTTSLNNSLQMNGGTINFGTGPTTISPSLAVSPSSGGVINCSTGSITITNGFTLSSGTFNGGPSPGILNISGAFVNSATYAPSNPGTFKPGTGTVTFNGSYTNSSIFTYSAGTVIFNSAIAQALIDNSSGGTNLNNVTFQGGGTQTMSGTGKFTVASTGSVTMGVSTTLGAAGKLTLKSDASGTGRVAAIPSTAKITGNVTVQRWFTGGVYSNRGWRMMSMPVNNSGEVPVNASSSYNFSSLKTNLPITGPAGSGGGFDEPAGYTVNGATILLYTPATRGLASPASVTTPVTVGTGFYFYFRGDNSNILSKLVRSAPGVNFATPEAGVVGLQTGSLNQQDFTYSLSTGGLGYNLVGNPYPSAITVPSGGDLGSVFTGTTGFVYTYTPQANSIAVEQASTATIASGQGFYVKTTTPSTSPNIKFTESLKTTTQPTGPNLLLGMPKGTESPILSLKMVQDSANYDITHLRFLDSYKPTYDETEDADDFNGSGQAVFLGAMTVDDHQVAIASQPLDKKRTSVFLSVNDNTSGLYTLQRINLAGIPAVYDVWLMDHFKNDSLDLRANTTYNFNLDKANPLTYGNTRFEIVIRKKMLPPYQLLSFSGNRKGAEVTLNWNTLNEYDYTGFELQKSTDGVNFEALRNMQSSSQGSYNFKDIYNSNSTAAIYYRLKQVDINDKVYYSNVIIITTTGNGSFSIFPNPASNVIKFNLDKSTIKSSSVRLNIYSITGLLVKTSSFTANTGTGQQDISTLMPGNYTIEITDTGSKKAIVTGKFIKL